MATNRSTRHSGQAVGSGSSIEPHSTDEQSSHSQPIEQLQIGDDEHTEDEVVYPSGIKVWLALSALYLGFFLNGLDLTIVAVAVPSLTNSFHTVDDIGWYSAAYFGKACTVYSPKSIVVFGLVAFVLGSLICTVAQSSLVFVLGRAVCGFGSSAFSSGALTLITHLFPSHKRSLWLSLIATTQSIGLAIAPLVGGGLIDRFSWRACFGINLPLCPLLIIFTVYFLHDPVQNPNYALSLLEKIKLLDLPGTVLVVPSITCLLMALQWGGIKYGWQDVRIIMLFVTFACLVVGFAYLQYRLGEKGTIPPRIVKKRSVLAGFWFVACCNGILATTEYYISIYWQGVRNESATKAGLLGVSMIVGLSVAGVLSGIGISKIGYFTPFMLATSIVAPIASGLLTTLNLDESKAKVVALLGLLGFGVGIGNMGPFQAVSTILSPNEVSIGLSIIGFGGGMGSALFICASATLFQNRLTEEIAIYAPGLNATAINNAGLSNIRNVIGKNRLQDALTGYDRAVVQTLYLPLGLALSTLIGSAAMEWTSVKKKRS